MSDLNELIARSSVLSYQQGRNDERLNILRLAKEACCENHIGEYVYLSDLYDYIEEWDMDNAKKRNPKKD